VRIVLVHNFYRSGSPGGEDVAFVQERELLEQAGHEVIAYTRSNDEMDESSVIDLARTAAGLYRSGRTSRELRSLLKSVVPDVVHVHNTFPLISESVFETCHEVGVPVVQTLHNYRFTCAAATHFRAGAVCQQCVPGDSWAAVRHRCYRNFPASAAMARVIVKNHAARAAGRGADRYLALNAFMAARLRDAGVPADRITIKPNFVRPPARVGDGEGRYALFAGRLSMEKGLHTLLDAWRDFGDWPLKIVGDGPLREALAQRIAQERLNVELLGMRPRAEVWQLLAAANALVVPSIWFEGMPLVALEAFAAGVPVVASRIGGLGELIGEDEFGLGFEVGDARALAGAMRVLRADAAASVRRCERARRRLSDEFSAERSLQILEATYRDVRMHRAAA
jgi:glycosyltransferase involved in cell wall biosynthesis